MPAESARAGFRAFVVFSVVAIVLAGAVIWIAGWDDPLADRRNPETEDAYADSEYTPLSAREEGYLRRMDVDDNQPVRAGQPIAELEDDDYKADVAQAEAQLDAARAALAELQGQQRVAGLQISQSDAERAGTQAQQLRAAEEMQRQAAILPTAMGLPTRYDAALAEDRRLAADTSAQAAQTTERRRQLAVLAAQELRAQADIEARQAQLDLAKIRLGYTVLRAPEDGVVGARQVRVGTLLEPGSTVVPFTRLQNVWITANFTERQLTDILPGQTAYVRMDTYPDVELRAHVDGISPLTGTQLAAIPADNATGNYTKVVQRVPVKIVLDDISPLAGRIRPGMSALVRIDTASHSYVRPAR